MIEYMVNFNLTILIIGLFVGALLIALAVIPPLQDLLKLQWPGWQHYSVAIASSLELNKLFHLKVQG